jgi:hypothetical protein
MGINLGFTKLDEGILQSSIMMEDPATFKIWIGLLASCGPDGIAKVSSVFLSSVCHLSLGITDKALEILEKPDPRSRGLAEEGRRIKRVDGGYFVINYGKYRAFTYSMKNDAVRQRRHRKAVKSVTERDISVTECDSHGHSASASSSLSSKNKDQEKNKGGCEIDIKLVQVLIDLMIENNPESSTIKRLTPKRQEEWIRQCRLLRDRDKRTPEEIEAVIRFCQADNFWKGNILSMPKLREKWDQLWMKAKGSDQYSGIRDWLKEGEAKRK